MHKGKPVTVWYLEMKEPAPAPDLSPPAGIRVEEACHPQFSVNQFLYTWIGAAWHWTDKLLWSDAQWRDYVERDSLRTWTATVDGSLAGYFELEKRQDQSVEICYFGLAQRFIGRGLGSYLLQQAIDEAWTWGANKVTVNTCSLDHPAALTNYQRRGFTLTETRSQ